MIYSTLYIFCYNSVPKCSAVLLSVYRSTKATRLLAAYVYIVGEFVGFQTGGKRNTSRNECLKYQNAVVKIKLEIQVNKWLKLWIEGRRMNVFSIYICDEYLVSDLFPSQRPEQQSDIWDCSWCISRPPSAQFAVSFLYFLSQFLFIFDILDFFFNWKYITNLYMYRLLQGQIIEE